MSVPTNETSLTLTAVDSGGKNTWELGQIRICAVPKVPTAGPETNLEALEGLLGRWRWAVAHSRDKDTDS